MPKVIRVDQVSKSFRTDFWKKPIVALEEVGFTVGKSLVHGLIGPNGAGKTTLIKIILGLMHPSSGSVSLFEEEKALKDVRDRIGYLPENSYYYDFLRPEEVLDFYASLFGLTGQVKKRRVGELLEMVGLSDRKNRPLRNFSKGMLQRVGIAQALINDPDLIILDEPMSGLDPIGRKDVRDIILSMKDQGKTILLASHILNDVESLCDEVAILVSGKLKANGSIDQLVNPNIERTDISFKGEWFADISEQLGASARKVGNTIMVSVNEPEEVENILSRGKALNLSLMGVHPHKESLEDIFVESVS